MKGTEKILDVVLVVLVVCFLLIMATWITDAHAQNPTVRFDRHIVLLEYSEQKQTYKTTLENGDAIELPKNLVVVVESPTPHNPRLIKYVGDKLYYIRTQYDKNKPWTKPTK